MDKTTLIYNINSFQVLKQVANHSFDNLMKSISIVILGYRKQQLYT